MPITRDDRQLTRESLEQALLLLLENQTLDQINISQLVQKAGVSRNSFYRNYGSKTELVRSIIYQQLQVLLVQAPVYADDPKAYLTFAFTYFFQEKASYQRLITEGLTGILQDFIYQVQPQAGQETSRLAYYKNLTQTAALTTLLIQWLSRDCLESIEEMVTIYQQLFPD